MRARLKELNQEKDVERRAKLTRIPKYKAALEWEAGMNKLSPATIEEARKRDARIKKQAASAQNRRR